MLDQKDRAGRTDLADERLQPCRFLVAHARHRFVEQHQARPARQGHADLERPPLAVRELVDAEAGPRPQADVVEHGAGALEQRPLAPHRAPRGQAAAGDRLNGQGDVVEHARAAEQTRDLERAHQAAPGPFVRRQAGDVDAVEDDAAAVLAQAAEARPMSSRRCRSADERGGFRRASPAGRRRRWRPGRRSACAGRARRAGEGPRCRAGSRSWRGRLRDASRQQPDQTVAREEDDREQHPAGPEFPVPGVGREHLLHQQQGGGPDQAAPDRGDAAEDDHHHERAGLRPVQHVRADVALQVDAERAGDAAERAGDDEEHQLVAVGRKAERLGADVVVAQGEHGPAEARRHEAGQADQGQRQHAEGDVVEDDRVLEVDDPVADAELRAGADVQALVAAVALDRVRQIEQHLCRRRA